MARTTPNAPWLPTAALVIAAAFAATSPMLHGGTPADGRESPAAAGHPAVIAVRTDRAPTLDGTLDDLVWRTAAPLRELRQVQPELGASGTEPTEVRVLYDASNLYIGIRCDEASGELLANDLSNDSRDTSTTAPAQGNVFESDDYVAVTIDTFGRQREGYYFAVNPAGAWADGLVYNTETLDLSWDTVWFNRVHRDASGWSVEIVVPFRSIAFNRQQSEWRINVERMMRRRQEVDRWTGVNRRRQVYSLAELGRLGGLGGMQQGLGVELKPYVLLRRDDAHGGTPGKLALRTGTDVIWKILPSLAATLTVNTDFAQTEVDQRQVNLTRFALFYPEKRDFFLRDKPFFAFGGIDSTTFVPYNSRSIGLANGAPVDLPVGAKIAGRAGPVTLGLLTTTVEASAGVPRRNLTVGRLACQVGDDSTVGVLFTNGDPRGPYSDTLWGADYNLVSNSWIPGRTVVGHAWVMGTRSGARGASDTAASVELAYPNDPYNIDVFVRQIGAKFDPALGFVQQTGVRDYHLFADRFWHPNGALVRDVDLGSYTNVTCDLHGRDVAEDSDMAKVTLVQPNGDNLSVWLSDYADRPLKPFDVSRGVVIPPAFYRWFQAKFQYVVGASRPLSGVAYFRIGDYYDGRETEEKGSVVWRPNGHWNTTVTYDLYQVRLPRGHFDVRNLSGSVAWHWSPYVFGSVLGQYDTQSRVFGLDARVQWIVAPGRTVYLVVDHGYFHDLDDRWRNVGGRQTLKVGWTWQY